MSSGFDNLPGSPKAPENGATEGETERECDGVDRGDPPSGLLQGVAVGVNDGVTRVDGVAAVIPRSFNNLAKPKVTENVHVELRLDRNGVVGTVLARLLLTVLIRDPCMLKLKCNRGHWGLISNLQVCGRCLPRC